MVMTDEALLDELRKRLGEKNKALFDLQASNRNLESVNEKLEESERLKSNFLSNIRNEINNPLTALLGLSSELTSPDGLEPEKLKLIADMINSEALNLDFQIRNVMTAADLEAGEAELYMTKTEISSLIDECLRSLAPAIKNNSIEIKKDGLEELWVNTDKEKLCIIILNLVDNAIVFNREGGTVGIHYGIEEDNLFISISDEGIGIAQEHHREIFDRFRQLDSGVSKKYKGHGLGLSVVRSGVDILLGRVEIDSTVGEGTTFTITVPTNEGMEIEGTFSDGSELFLDEGDDMQEF